jgi:hypothetical protein
MMVNEIGVNAIWFDHAVNYYNSVGGSTFNQMMETLHQMFPNVLFFLNVTSPTVLIRPSGRTNWNSSTYVFPTAHLTGGNLSIEGLGGTGKQSLIKYNGLFKDKVVVHFDSQASNPNEPMSEFANMTSASETSIIRQAFTLGIHPAVQDQGFNVLVPIVGANTYSYSGDGGTIYNALTAGLDGRGTAGGFLKVMQQYFP